MQNEMERINKYIDLEDIKDLVFEQSDACSECPCLSTESKSFFAPSASHCQVSYVECPTIEKICFQITQMLSNSCYGSYIADSFVRFLFHPDFHEYLENEKDKVLTEILENGNSCSAGFTWGTMPIISVRLEEFIKHKIKYNLI